LFVFIAKPCFLMELFSSLRGVILQTITYLRLFLIPIFSLLSNMSILLMPLFSIIFTFSLFMFSDELLYIFSILVSVLGEFSCYCLSILFAVIYYFIKLLLMIRRANNSVGVFDKWVSFAVNHGPDIIICFLILLLSIVIFILGLPYV
jgi:hypothetical protein